MKERINERRMMAEEINTHPEVVLLINELHNLVGTSRTKGSNIMKPALAHGELRCIGATSIGGEQGLYQIGRKFRGEAIKA